MKIPENIGIVADSDTNPMLNAWKEAAVKISVETGVFVEVIAVHRGGIFVDELLFRVMGNEFGSLKELKRALELKAFL